MVLGWQGLINLSFLGMPNAALDRLTKPSLARFEGMSRPLSPMRCGRWWSRYCRLSRRSRGAVGLACPTERP